MDKLKRVIFDELEKQDKDNIILKYNDLVKDYRELLALTKEVKDFCESLVSENKELRESSKKIIKIAETLLINSNFLKEQNQDDLVKEFYKFIEEKIKNETQNK